MTKEKKAHDLAAGIRTFDPAPLEFRPGADHAFYVERPDDPLETLRARLLHGSELQKYLLSGHRGSGKSTELNRLAADPAIRARYAVVKFSVLNVLDVTDLSYVDLLFTAVAVTYNELIQSKDPLALSKEALEQLDSWRRTVEERLRTQDESAGTDVEAGAGLPAFLGGFFARFSGRLKVEHTTRKLTREIVEPQLSNFLSTLDHFFDDVEHELGNRGKHLLLVIEDLDKIPDIAKAVDLFHDKGLYLTRPPCRIVYTVPIPIHYSKEFQGIARIFGQSLFLPNVALAERVPASEEYPPGRALMKDFILKRLDASLITNEALEEAVAVSGGVFQQMQRLMEDACVRALTRQLPQITPEVVLRAAAELRNELERTIASEDLPILMSVRETKEVASDDISLSLLHSLHLVEYRNSERWCDVNPLLYPTLERWKKQKRQPEAGFTT